MSIFKLVLALFAIVLGFETQSEASPGIDNRQGVQILDHPWTFLDEQGRTVDLGQYFNSDRSAIRPVILAFVYFGCPGACTVLLHALADGLKQLSIRPGRAYEVVVVSIDPQDTAEGAKAKKDRFILMFGQMLGQQLGQPGVETKIEGGIHFLTGTAAEITALTERVGFRYEYDPKTEVFIHPSALFVFTPQGILSSTLTGSKFSPKILRKTLLLAAGGQMGTLVDRWISLCYGYLPHTGWLDRPSRWLAFLLSFGCAAGTGFCVWVGRRARVTRLRLKVEETQITLGG